ncbi:hypothetical protein M0G43_15180 [Subsaxibacter sp. CAU 1640]|uniref:hypothetical protein n=1 Tax=Subsaxibacter sp. CAU 1640 TaxID=2933271 RepID=UPI00200388CD|nr:hypothetical protein [Subsaxibacter sp. CAU 1640]MCK7591929.1 hypothetical protein [Subsaxibacter sp. CAU 1640]
MTINRRFHTTKLDLSAISKERWILAVVIGLAYAFMIYAFIYVLIEGLRRMSFVMQNDPLIISDANRSLYNLFFAGLSLIFGNSIAINYIFSTSYSSFFKPNRYRHRILNDQSFLNGGFVHWFLRMALTFGVFSIGMMDFEYLPYLFPVGILILLVLYLNGWMSLLRILSKKKYIYLLLHFVAMCVLSFGLSKINIVDYKALDAGMLEANPIIDVPSSSFYIEEKSRSDLYLYYKLRLDKNGELEIISEDYKHYKIDDMFNVIQSELQSRREELRSYHIAGIIADRHLPMKHIIEFQNMVCRGGINKYTYVINDGDNVAMRFDYNGIEVRGCLPYYCNDLMVMTSPVYVPEDIGLEQLNFVNERYQGFDRLVFSIGETITIDDVAIPNDMLARKFKNTINDHTLFVYSYTDATEYQNYIKVLSAHFEATYSLREANETIKINGSLYDFDAETRKKYEAQQDSLKELFPIIKLDSIRR